MSTGLDLAWCGGGAEELHTGVDVNMPYAHARKVMSERAAAGSGEAAAPVASLLQASVGCVGRGCVFCGEVSWRTQIQAAKSCNRLRATGKCCREAKDNLSRAQTAPCSPFGEHKLFSYMSCI